MEMINAVGRRKTAVARVYLMKGEGKITVNGKDYREYFPRKCLRPESERAWWWLQRPVRSRAYGLEPRFSETQRGVPLAA